MQGWNDWQGKMILCYVNLNKSGKLVHTFNLGKLVHTFILGWMIFGGKTSSYFATFPRPPWCGVSAGGHTRMKPSDPRFGTKSEQTPARLLKSERHNGATFSPSTR